MTKVIHVDLTPIQEFRYIQISNYEFQYLLLDKKFRAIHSPFMCKDYIQDIFYTEYTGHCGQIWGMDWKPGMLDVNVKTFKLALHGGNVKLQEHVPYLKEFLNTFEKTLGIPLSKVKVTDDPKIIVIYFSKDWTENGPLLSAFTTMIRISGGYHGEGVLEYLKELLPYAGSGGSLPAKYPRYVSPDVANLQNTLPKFSALLQGLRPEHDWNTFPNMMSVHNTGIVGYSKFPVVEVK